MSFRKIKILFKSIYTLLTKRYVIISLDEDNFINYLKDNEYECGVEYYRMHQFNCAQIMKEMAEQIKEEDLILLKAEYGSEYDKYLEEIE